MKVIDYKYLPTRFPVWQTVVVWLVLDRLQPGDWLQGAAWTFMVFVWIATFVMVLKETGVSPKEI